MVLFVKFWVILDKVKTVIIGMILTFLIILFFVDVFVYDMAIMNGIWEYAKKDLSNVFFFFKNR